MNKKLKSGLRSKIGALLLSVMAFSSMTSFADMAVQPVLISAPINAVDTVKDEMPVPTLYGNESVPFTVKQSGDAFTIILDSNPSTGYSWTYKVNDEKHVNFKSEDFIAPAEMIPGAGGKATFTFSVTGDGVSTIDFEYAQAWVGEAVESLSILVYKTGETVIVEEDGIVAICVENPTEGTENTIKAEKLTEAKTVSDSNDLNQVMDGKIEIDKESRKVIYKGEEIGDFGIEDYDDITMIPLSSTLKALGYEVSWNGETRAVDIQKGAQWTSIKIGENAYFKNRMAARPLSAEPIIIDGYTYVPAEFLVEILGLGVQIESGSLILTDAEAVVHSGYVTDIRFDETGTMTITIADEKDSTDYMNATVIHTSDAFTYYNTEVKVGSYIHVASPMVMTMSLPPQTSGYIVY